MKIRLRTKVTFSEEVRSEEYEVHTVEVRRTGELPLDFAELRVVPVRGYPVIIPLAQIHSFEVV